MWGDILARPLCPAALFGPTSRFVSRQLVYMLGMSYGCLAFASGLIFAWFGSSMGSSNFPVHLYPLSG